MPPSHTCLLEEEEEELDYNDSPAIVVEDNPEDVTGVTEDVTGATAGFLEGRGSQEKGKRVQLRSIAVKPPGHRVSYKEALTGLRTFKPRFNAATTEEGGWSVDQRSQRGDRLVSIHDK